MSGTSDILYLHAILHEESLKSRSLEIIPVYVSVFTVFNTEMVNVICLVSIKSKSRFISDKT